jgi:hypothetical protein
MTPLYGLSSDRPRLVILAEYAARHGLTARQVEELTRQLPDYGRSADVVVLAEYRKPAVLVRGVSSL